MRHSGTKRNGLLTLVIAALILLLCLTLFALSLENTCMPAFAADSPIWDGTADTSFDGQGTEEEPFLIFSAEELAGLSVLINLNDVDYNSASVYYRLENNIVLNDTSDWAGWGGYRDSDEALADGIRSWTPIGTDSYPFCANFDGSNKSVSGVYMDANGDRKGLFGYAATAVIKNLGVEESYIQGEGYVGGIVGYGVRETLLQNCRNQGTIRGRYAATGGIAGSNNGEIKNCHNLGRILGGDYAGGIVGILSGGSVFDCGNTGIVSGANKTIGKIGGVVGSSSKNTAIVNCYNSAEVTGASDSVGGITGDAAVDSSVTNCYSRGAVSGRNKVGGIIGYSLGSVENVYSVGDVSGNTSIGGIAGFCDAVENAYYLSGCAESPIGNSEGSDTIRAFDSEGVLASPVTVDGIEASSLAAALNLFVRAAEGTNGYLYFAGTETELEFTSETMYCVSFNGNGGIPAFYAVFAKGGDVLAIPATAMQGHTVDWYKDSSFSNIWDFDNDIVSGELTLYAKFTPITYTVFYENMAGASHHEQQAFSHTYGTETELFSPTKVGYDFCGWYTDEVPQGSPVTSLTADGYTADITLYARWQLVAPTLTLVDGADEWAVSGKYDGNAKILTYAATHILSDEEGFEFGYSWYAEGVLVDATKDGKFIDTTDSGTYTLRLTANYEGESSYEEKTVTVAIEKAVYDMRGIALADAIHRYDGTNKTLIISGTLPSGVEVRYKNNGMKEPGSYTVTAKFLGDGTNYEPIPDLTATLVIYRLTVGGGDGIDEAVFDEYILGSTLAPPPPRDGYDFVGWYSDDTFSEEVTVINAADIENGTVTLYPKWQKKSASVGIATIIITAVVIVGIIVFLIILIAKKRKG